MATWFVRSSASGSNNGTSWTNAWTSLEYANTTTTANGDLIFVSDDHNESKASLMTLAFSQNNVLPHVILSVNASSNLYSATMNANVKTTGTANLTITGAAYFSGIHFQVGSGTSAAYLSLAQTAGSFQYFDHCKVTFGSTSGINQVQVAGTSGLLLSNTSFNINTNFTTAFINFRGRVTWEDTPVDALGIGVNFPNLMIGSLTGIHRFKNLDLSNYQNKYVLAYPTGAAVGDNIFENVKLGANTVLTNNANPPVNGVTRVYGYNFSNTYTINNIDYVDYSGNISTETTIVMTGGATTPANNGYSIKFDTSTNCIQHLPLKTSYVSYYNKTSGSPITVTIQGAVTGGDPRPNNEDIWFELFYLGTSGSSVKSKVSSGKTNPLASNTAYDAGSGSWSGATNTFSMNVTFTPIAAGMVDIQVKAGKANSTFYIDPKPQISNANLQHNYVISQGTVSDIVDGETGGGGDGPASIARVISD